MLTSFLNRWNQVPKPFKIFFFRALILLVFWKTIYLAFLLPMGVPDTALTKSIGVQTSNTLNVFTNTKDFSSNSKVVTYSTASGVQSKTQQAIYYHGYNIVSIEDACNGLELGVLYIGFLLALPAKINRKITFTLVGILVIYLVNVLRCVGITLVCIYYPKHADFTHHYIFTFVVYAFIIWLWLIYTKKLTSYATSE